LCRLESHQWPAFQHEIHFHASTEAHRAAAKTIYERDSFGLLKAISSPGEI
jgi:hypothetical protein